MKYVIKNTPDGTRQRSCVRGYRVASRFMLWQHTMIHLRWINVRIQVNVMMSLRLQKFSRLKLAQTTIFVHCLELDMTNTSARKPIFTTFCAVAQEATLKKGKGKMFLSFSMLLVYR